jgi:uncharacterized protein YjiS (DUF1127 family)
VIDMDGSTIGGRVTRSRKTEPWRTTLQRPIEQAIAGIRVMIRLRRNAAELMSLDDRMLADIGLGSDEIEPAVRFGRSFIQAPYDCQV